MFYIVLLACVVCNVAGKASSKPSGKPAKKSTPSAGSSKCEKGNFVSLSKDSTIPLCDAHYPDEKAKSSWLVLFYDKESPSLQEVMNRVAMDLGNEPPEKSKNLKKAPKKWRARIKDLAEKYEFEANIPKKGLEEHGKEPLLKVGAVCCNCGEEQKLCKTRPRGIRIVQPKKEEVVMPGGEENIGKADEIVKWLMGELGFVKGYQASASSKAQGDKPLEADGSSGETSRDEPVAADPSSSGTSEGLEQLLQDLEAKKKKAIADEDYELAKKLKQEAEKLKKEHKNVPQASLQKQLEELREKKKKAAADEDFKLASQLKKDIAKLESKLEAGKRDDL